MIDLLPGQPWQPVIDAHPPGTEFYVRAGVHRQQTARPKDTMAFVGEPGAVLTGARLLSSSGFAKVGSGLWAIGGQTQSSPLHGGACQLTPRYAESWDGCDYNEECFLDGVRLRHVTSRDQVASGRWFFDYATDTIYLGDDPRDRQVETSITPYAFLPTGAQVAIRDLTIQQYACPAQYGAINAEDAPGWTVMDCLLHRNHGGGIRIGPNMVVRRNTIVHNGQIGVVGAGDGTVLEANEIAFNNEAHYDAGWEAGGLKIVLSDAVVIRGNTVHHNGGPGIWADIDNSYMLIERNLVEDNEQIGIFYEISYGATIRRNLVRRNGLAPWVSDYIWGAGILVAASSNVEVYDNTLTGNRGGICGVQQARGSGALGPHYVTGLYVHHNTTYLDQIGIENPVWSGLCDDTGSSTIFTSDGNRYCDNTYLLKAGGSGNYFVWNNAERPFESWQGCGQDTAGTAEWY